MPDVITATYDFTLPEVGASDDTWGTKLNANWQKMETLLDGAFTSGAPTALGGTLELVGSAPNIRFQETDQTPPAGQYRNYVNGDVYFLQRALTANFATNTNAYAFDGTTLDVKVLMLLSGSAPSLRFEETDQTDPAGRFRFYISGDSFYFQKALTANWGSADTLFNYDNNFEFYKPVVLSGGVAGTTTFSGTCVISSVAPQLRFDETDQTTPAGQYRNYVNGDVYFLQRTLTADFATVTNILSYSGSAVELTTYPTTKLATVGGSVEVGHTGSGEISLKRTGGINYLRVPDGASLRVTNASNVAWGSISSASGWAAGSSDARLKENIRDIHYGLDTIMQLRPVEFDWIAEQRHDIGLIAQEVRPLVPEIIEVWETEEAEQIDMLALRKDALVAVLIKAMQELTARVQTLEGAN